MKLDIGCGENRHAPDYTTVDLYNPKADIQATMWELPFPDNSVDEIWSEASLEHIPRPKIDPTLKEWLRVLKPEGTVVISVPDLDWVCRQWLEKKQPFIHAWIFGNQNCDGDYHMSGWDIALFWQDLQLAGFEIANVARIWSHDQEMLRATCNKPPAGQEAKRYGFVYMTK